MLSEQVARSCQMCEISRSHQQLLQATSENMNWAKAVLTASKRVQVAKSGLEVDYIHEKASCEQQHGSICLTHTLSIEYQISKSFRGTTLCAAVSDRTFTLLHSSVIDRRSPVAGGSL